MSRNHEEAYLGKRLTPRTAIRRFCRWCNGGCPSTCVSPSCPLYTPSPSPLRAIHAYCLECTGSAKAVRSCAAYKPFSEVQPACPLWPHRLGKRRVTMEYRAARREQAKGQLAESGPGAIFSSNQPSV